MIRLENVSFVYGKGTNSEKIAIDNINLTINQGEFIGIVGHTGSGKSTLIEHLNGLLKATSGKIYFNDKNIYDKKYNLRELRGKVGLVFQYPEHQLFEPTVFEDVCFGPKNLGLDKEEVEIRGKEALSLVGIDESIYKVSPFELSGGQKRRVAIAGILAMKPDVLVLDEPASSLDPKGKKDIFDMISNIHKEKNTTVILVSHSMEDIAEYVDRMIVMNEGKIKYDGSPKDIFKKRYELEEIGLGVPQVTVVLDELRKKGYDIKDNPITVDSATNCIMDYIKEKDIILN